MTTIEHAFVGINTVFATGMYRKHGWQLVAVTAFASILPDWDALTFLWSVELFDTAHRSWGHSLLVCFLVSTVFAIIDYRFDFVTGMGRWFQRVSRLEMDQNALKPRTNFLIKPVFIWGFFANLAGLLHLLADIVVSGHPEMANWGVRVFWPFSNAEIAFPMISWGDIGVSIIFFTGMFAMLKWKSKVQPIAALIFVAVILYIIVF